MVKPRCDSVRKSKRWSNWICLLRHSFLLNVDNKEAGAAAVLTLCCAKKKKRLVVRPIRHKVFFQNQGNFEVHINLSCKIFFPLCERDRPVVC